ncbi:MAG: GTP cyclohydrolase I FolE2 [Betaproteobacteria bacterium TMED156]|nr:MAG: GTP cyclohydrolase I FolE2 [Betaproteobacteria bacterium TMED156]
MNAPEQFSTVTLPDVQSESDGRAIEIQRVGIRGLKYPVVISTTGDNQNSIATIDMTVSLEASIKGTHMSRFVEIFQDHNIATSAVSLVSLGEKMLDKLEAKAGWIKISFPYFINKTAPVSEVKSLMDYAVTWELEIKKNGYKIPSLTVIVPVTSLCPCSKNISEYGAHNQRSHISITTDIVDLSLSINKLIFLAENAASCELWGLLKRPDEKYVTETAYNNPKFVEDLVRDVAISLEKLKGQGQISGYSVESENFESIHNHSAFARIDKRKRLP